MSTPSSDDELIEIGETTDSLRNSSVKGTRPVTVRQLLDATLEHSDASFKIDGIEVDQVMVVAQPFSRSCNSQSLILFELEDGTSRGRIGTILWRTEDENGWEIIQRSVSYVQVLGKLQRRSREARNTLKVIRVHEVVDVAHHVFFHLLEAAFVTLCHERGTPPSTDTVAATNETVRSPDSQVPVVIQSTSVATTPAGNSHEEQSDERAPRDSTLVRSPTPQSEKSESENSLGSSSDYETASSAGEEEDMSQRSAASPVERVQTPATPPPSSSPPRSEPRNGRRVSGIKQDPYSEYTVLERAILLQILNAPSSAEGQSAENIAKGVSHHNVTSQEINDALCLLLDEEVIETTVDELHFAMKATRYPAKMF